MPAPANGSPSPTADKPPRLRRRIPLSLRMFVAILGLLGIVSTAMVGIPVCRQQLAIRQFQQHGCQFYTQPGGPAWLRRWVGDRRMKLFDQVVMVDLRRAKDTDGALAHLNGLTSVREVILIGTPITDSGLMHLKGLTNLQRLLLMNTSVTDAGLVHLKGLTNMKVLKLDNTRVTDAGLAHLQGMTRMEGLSLVGTSVTEVGMQHLKGLPKLRLLVLSNVAETSSGVAELKQALPGLRVGPSW